MTDSIDQRQNIGAAGVNLQKQRMRQVLQVAGMLPVLILLGIGFELLSGRFLHWNNIVIVMQQASINTVLAAGMTFVILTGGIDLSVGSIVAVTAMATMIVSLIPDYGLLGILAGLATGLVCGLLNGAFIAALRLPPFIVTLGSLTAVRGVARLFGADTTVFNSDLPFAFIGNGTLLGVPWLVIIAFLVVFFSWVVLRRTVLGTRIYAVGGNPDAARLAGINVERRVATGFLISGAIAGLCLTTEANLGDGIFPTREYLDAGGAFGVGSDSHIGVDWRAELRLLEYGQRLKRRERNVLASPETAQVADRLFDAALAGGARATGRAVGALQEGARADWVVLDAQHPNLAQQTPRSWLSSVVFCEHGETPVRDVYVGGEQVVAQRRHRDETRLYADYRKALNHLLAGA